MATTKGRAQNRGVKKNSGRKGASGGKRGSSGAGESLREARRQTGAVVLFALGLLSVCLALIEGDKLWLTLHNTLAAFFGGGSLLFGAMLLYIAVLQAMGRPWQGRAILCGATLLSFCGALQIFVVGLPSSEHVLDQIVECVQQGIAGHGGGAAGIFPGLMLLKLFGKLGSGIIIVLLLVVLVLLLSGATLVTLARAARKPVRAVRSAYNEELAYRQKAAEKRKQQQQSKTPQTQRENRTAAGAAPPVEAPTATAAQKRETILEKSRRIDVPLDGETERDAFVTNGTKESPVVKAENMVTQVATAREPEPAVKGDPPVIDIEMDDQYLPEQAGGFALGSAAGVRAKLDDEPVQMASQQQEERDPDLDALVRRALAQGDCEDRFSVPEESAAEAAAQWESALKLPPILSDGEDVQDVMARDPFFMGRSTESSAQDRDGYRLENGVQTERSRNQEKMRQVLQDVRQGWPMGADTGLSSVGMSEQDIPSALEEPTPVAEPEIVRPPRPPYRKPPVTLLNPLPPKSDVDTEEMKGNAQLLVDTLASFGVQTRIVDIARGPAVTRYELQPSAGVKISRITALADDIALNLAASGVRIEAPIPNKAAVGIEVPNKVVSPVHFRELVESAGFQESKSRLTVALGRDIAGQIALGDIASMPHVLIAGSTGSGKSVCINSIIMSLLYQATPEEVRFLMIDPKVVELGVYNGIPHLLVPVVTEPKKAAGALSWAVKEMLERYKRFADTSVRDLKSYNAQAAQREGWEKLPQIVIIIDELADLMMAAPNEIEDYICRLAQMARAAGMHLIIATQRPSVDVITGVIKANIPSRIAFAVSSAVDSRTILDSGGAEKLLGKGDMLFNPIGSAKPRRVQGCFVTDEEIERVISFIKEDFSADYNETIAQQIDSHVLAGKGGNKGGAKDVDEDEGGDEMLMQAIECVVEAGSASTSFIQRRLKVGYARAGRLMDTMEAMGIVGPYDGAKPRQVLIGPAQLAEMKHSRGL